MEKTWKPDPIHGKDLLGEFPASEMLEVVAEAVEKCTGHAKESARSALFHLGKGWRIRKIDVEMALFRGITAKEEAVAALFLSLKRLNYEKAELLNERSHVHKAAMHVLRLAVSRALDTSQFVAIMRPTLKIPVDDSAGKPHLTFRPPVPVVERPVQIQPDAPLNFSFQDVDGSYSFWEEVLTVMQEAASRSTAKSLKAQIQETANRRNQILYAHEGGIPLVLPSTVEDHLRGYGEFVSQVLVVFVLVDQYETHQLLVQQLLDVFLRIVAKADRNLARKLRSHGT